MPIPFRPTALLVALALVSATACGDDTRLPTAYGVSRPPGSITDIGVLGAKAREVPVGDRVLLEGPLMALWSYAEIYDGLVWTLSDTRFAEANPTGTGGVWIRGLVPGTAALTVMGGSLKATIPISVLDTTDAPSPVVVDSVYLIEFERQGQRRYAPQIVLRDTSGRIGSAVIAARFELPGLGPGLQCAMLRTVFGAPTNLWHGDGAAPELSLEGPSGDRIPPDGVVLVQLTLRVPGPFAKRVTVQGRVAPGTPPTTYREGIDTDVLSCW
jgi:hypothetical protein